jgi:hypothetical protein
MASPLSKLTQPLAPAHAQTRPRTATPAAASGARAAAAPAAPRHPRLRALVLLPVQPGERVRAVVRGGLDSDTCERGAGGRTQVEAVGGKAVDGIAWVRGE